jgi:hypothetical protein
VGEDGDVPGPGEREDEVQGTGTGIGENGEDAPQGGAHPGGRPDEPGDGALLGAAPDLRQRWDAVQVGFVDDPRAAVEAAAGMVSEAAAALQAEIERRRAALAGSPGGEAEAASTDALLAAFHDYRTLFDRVVSA